MDIIRLELARAIYTRSTQHVARTTTAPPPRWRGPWRRIEGECVYVGKKKKQKWCIGMLWYIIIVAFVDSILSLSLSSLSRRVLCALPNAKSHNFFRYCSVCKKVARVDNAQFIRMVFGFTVNHEIYIQTRRPRPKVKGGQKKFGTIFDTTKEKSL